MVSVAHFCASLICCSICFRKRFRCSDCDWRNLTSSWRFFSSSSRFLSMSPLIESILEFCSTIFFSCFFFLFSSWTFFFSSSARPCSACSYLRIAKVTELNENNNTCRLEYVPFGCLVFCAKLIYLYLRVVQCQVGLDVAVDVPLDSEEKETSLWHIEGDLADNLLEALLEQFLSHGANAALTGLTLHQLLIQHFSQTGYVDSAGRLWACFLHPLLAYKQLKSPTRRCQANSNRSSVMEKCCCSCLTSLNPLPGRDDCIENLIGLGLALHWGQGSWASRSCHTKQKSATEYHTLSALLTTQKWSKGKLNRPHAFQNKVTSIEQRIECDSIKALLQQFDARLFDLE